MPIVGFKITHTHTHTRTHNVLVINIKHPNHKDGDNIHNKPAFFPGLIIFHLRVDI